MRRHLAPSILAVLLAVLLLSPHLDHVLAQANGYTMQAGETLNVACASGLSGVVNQQTATLVCATLVPTATATATMTMTPVATSTQVPTATTVATAGQPCPKALHDAITTTGPDGKQYPTWHPPVDPATGCVFGHEHGADPRTSAANNTLPPFGYLGALDGMVEPHEGFKVFITKAGDPGDNGPSPSDIRVVFHMGTSGVGRYTTEFHSMMYDEVARDGSGRYQHLQGMSDTFTHVGSTCDNPRQTGRDFSTLGCPDFYEIWAFQFMVIHPNDPYVAVDQVRTTAGGAVASFNPILTRDPADNSRVVYTQSVKGDDRALDPLSPRAYFRGCDREYYAQSYWNNASRPTTYWTDTRGHVNPAGEAPGLLRQDVSASAKFGYPSFKARDAYCDPTVHAPN